VFVEQPNNEVSAENTYEQIMQIIIIITYLSHVRCTLQQNNTQLEAVFVASALDDM